MKKITNAVLSEKLVGAALVGDLKQVSSLLSRGADGLFDNSRALRHAAEHGRIKCLELLIPVSNPLAYESHALQLAAMNGHIDCVKLLIPHSNPLADNSLALLWAAENGHVECVGLLIPVSNPRDGNSSALTAAAFEGHAECVELLLPASNPLDCDSSALFAAAKSQNLACAKLFIPFYKVTTQTQEILEAALTAAFPEMIFFLLEIGQFREKCHLSETLNKFRSAPEQKNTTACLAALAAFIEAEDLAAEMPFSSRARSSVRL